MPSTGPSDSATSVQYEGSAEISSRCRFILLDGGWVAQPGHELRQNSKVSLRGLPNVHAVRHASPPFFGSLRQKIPEVADQREGGVRAGRRITSFTKASV
jgi:hypothetical protein